MSTFGNKSNLTRALRFATQTDYAKKDVTLGPTDPERGVVDVTVRQGASRVTSEMFVKNLPPTENLVLSDLPGSSLVDG
jgi:hypothetical protein